MKKIINKNELLLRRRDLRKSMTHQEILLWEHFRRKQMGYRIHRQYSIGSFVVDFYCPKAKLIIEIDGYHHNKPEEIEYDTFRTKFFEELGLNVIRFTNQQINTNLVKVLTAIKAKLLSSKEERASTPPPSIPPHLEEGGL